MCVYFVCFDGLFYVMVVVGEIFGYFDGVLNWFVDYIEQCQQFCVCLLQVMIYFIVLMLVVISVIVILFFIVVLKVVEQFVYFKQVLFFFIWLLMSLSDIVCSVGFWLVLLLLLVLLVLCYLLCQFVWWFVWDWVLLCLLVIGCVVCSVNSVCYVCILSIFNVSVVLLLLLMCISVDVFSNVWVCSQLVVVSELVCEGVSLYWVLEFIVLFLLMMCYMIVSGEQSGELIVMLECVVENQDWELSVQIQMVFSLFEFLLVVIMVGMVLFIVLVILQLIL